MPIFSSPAVGSVFSRTGNVVAAPGDYTAAQVTNSADKSSASIQSFVSELLSPALEASGIGGLGVTRLVGSGTAAPVAGTWLTGDYVIDYTNKQFYACTAGGTPGTWVTLGGAAGISTSDTEVSGGTILPGATGTVFTTAPLALGTYLIIASLPVNAAAAFTGPSFCIATLLAGTATAVVNGGNGSSSYAGWDSAPSTDSFTSTVNIAIVQVTTAGTMKVTLQNMATSGNIQVYGGIGNLLTLKLA